ncbi:MAG: tetratricopeptide repeat protein [Candidatus Brocadia sp.]|nr:tetratricopeptide repeat protein [Candidatus Brocadia sp.]
MNSPNKMKHFKLFFFVVVLFGWVSLGWIDPLADRVREGNRLYNDSKYDEALDKYVNAQVNSPNAFQLDFNIANAQYKRSKYPEAAQLFEKVIRSGDIEMKAKSSFNMGNTLYRQGQMKEALECYKKTVDFIDEIEHKVGSELDTLKNDAKYNYEYVERKMQENEQKQQGQDQKDQQQEEEEDKNDKQQSDDNKSEDEENQESQKDKQEPSPESTPEENKNKKEDNQGQSDKDKQKEQHSEQQQPQPQNQKQMTKEEAERLLEALNNNEKETRLMKRDTQRLQHKSVEKDW